MNMTCFVSIEIETAKRLANEAIAKIEECRHISGQNILAFLHKKHLNRFDTWWGRFFLNVRPRAIMTREEHDRMLKATGKHDGYCDWEHYHDKQLVLEVKRLTLIPNTDGYVQLSPAHVRALTQTYEPHLQGN